MKLISLCTHPNLIPNLYDFLSLAKFHVMKNTGPPLTFAQESHTALEYPNGDEILKEMSFLVLMTPLHNKVF